MLNKLKTFIYKVFHDNSHFYTILRFLFVGGLATLIDYLASATTLYIYLGSIEKVILANNKEIELPLLIIILATGIGFLFGLIFNYIFSVIFVFDSNKFAKTGRGKFYFTILALVGLIVTLIGMYIFCDLLHVHYWIMKVILTIVVLVFNYLTRRFILFKQKND